MLCRYKYNQCQGQGVRQIRELIISEHRLRLASQIVNDVLAQIEPSNAFDIREEAMEDTVVRMLNMLRILKYKPPQDDP